MALPDREVRHEPACCSRCGAGLAGRPVTSVERHQVLDLPPVRDAYVIEPGHDAWVIGSQPFVAYEFDSSAADTYAWG